MKQNEEQEWISDPNEKIKETPLQSYNRIRDEIESFIGQLKQLKEAKENGSQNIADSSDPEEMILNLEMLKHQLKMNSIREKEMDQFVQNVSTKNLDSSLNDKSKEEIKKLADLDRRLNYVDSILGKEEDKMCCFNFYSSRSQSLVENVKTLLNRLNGFDLNSIDKLDSRLTSLLHKLNQISDKKEVLQDAESKQKIDDLFDIVNKNQNKLTTVKEVASRLNLLSQIEEQAVQFKEALNYMESLQNKITATIDCNEIDLKALKENFDTNLKFVNDAMDDIQKRINALK